MAGARSARRKAKKPNVAAAAPKIAFR